jgi:phage tail protein X
VDINLVVEDGHRHLAYVLLNLLGVAHAVRHRGKPVDAHSARPIAPRVMTANLVLERSQCFPLARQDEDMAYELLASRTVIGGAFLSTVVAANPGIAEHFPQLRESVSASAAEVRSRLPRALFPAFLDRPAKAFGRAAWRYMQWTRRNRPEAIARVAFVRSTMRPYALFDD